MTKVRVLRAFVANVEGVKIRGIEDEILDMPKGQDWIKAGLVEPLQGGSTRETAAVEPSEKAVEPKAAAKKPASRKKSSSKKK